MIAACDYVLLSPEMYNVTAYFTEDLNLLGSIVGEDTLSMIIIILLIIATASLGFGLNLMKTLGTW
jgi:polyferredoxin